MDSEKKVIVLPRDAIISLNVERNIEITHKHKYIIVIRSVNDRKVKYFR